MAPRPFNAVKDNPWLGIGGQQAELTASEVRDIIAFDGTSRHRNQTRLYLPDRNTDINSSQPPSPPFIQSIKNGQDYSGGGAIKPETPPSGPSFSPHRRQCKPLRGRRASLWRDSAIPPRK